MSDASQFNKHDDPRYERPNARWRCGRAACWGAPCGKGPNPDGSCGADAGQQRCVPRPTLRVLRGRATFLAASVTVLFLAVGFHFGARRTGGTTSLTADPGPLSAIHANFTESQSCATCHPAHVEGIAGLVRAAFTPHDMTGKCVDCHTFGGRERLAHNKTYTHRKDISETRCTTCHTEHHGTTAPLTSMKESQCQHCHQVKFDNFAQGHPPFPTNFPHLARSGIQFDHGRHLNDYFGQPQFRDRAPAACQECHKVSAGVRNVTTVSFDQACARCHAQDTQSRSFHLITLPESTTNTQPVFALEDMTPLMQHLLGPTNDAPGLSARILQLMKGLTNGTAAFGTLLDRASSRPVSSNLLAGLKRDSVVRPAIAWWQGESVPLDSVSGEPGWSWSSTAGILPELHYVPLGHADPAARAWLEFAAGATNRATNADVRQPAQALRGEWLNPATGGGRCVKCHVVSESRSTGQPLTEIAWRYRGSQLGAHTTFSHGTHAGVASCKECHVQNAKVDFAAQFKPGGPADPVSNFNPITTANCLRCHTESKVRSDCFLCHRYHESPGLRRSVLTAK